MGCNSFNKNYWVFSFWDGKHFRVDKNYSYKKGWGNKVALFKKNVNLKGFNKLNLFKFTLLVNYSENVKTKKDMTNGKRI